MARKSGCILTFLLGVFLLAVGLQLHGHKIDGTKASTSSGAYTEAPRVALTFDDGPNPIYTEILLDGLKKRGVKASFFLMGKRIPGNEKLVERMHQEGHLIGNHTYDHVQLTKLTDREACSQLTRTSNLIYEITGEYPIFVRPPFGEWKKGIDCVVTMLPVMWDVDPVDWNTSDTNLVVRRVEKAVEDTDIILLHDNYESSVQAALQIVDDLTALGYEFVTVDELLLE